MQTKIEILINVLYERLGVLINTRTNFLFGEDQCQDDEANRINEMYSKWFTDLTNDEIKNQVKSLMSKRDVIEKTFWEVSQQLELPASLQQKLLTYFSYRFDFLASYYGFATQRFAKRDKAAIAGKTAAGVMHLQRNKDGKLCALLSKRVTENWCDNFGGKSDKDDKTIAFTAQRETHEESDEVLWYSDRELAEAPFHDIISLDEEGKKLLYRMYFIRGVKPIDITKMTDHEHTAHYWVPLENLQTALQENLQITEEGKTTILVNDEKGEKLIIFPPLYEMLKQQPVQRLINSYIQDKPKVTRTQGLASYILQEENETNPYRPLVSPDQIKEGIITTQLNKGIVLDKIKHQRHPLYKKNRTEVHHENKLDLSQSEFHLKSIMGHDFNNEASIATNVKTFLDNYCEQNYSEIDKDKLTKQAVEMIAYEKAHPEMAFFYHGASSEIAYAYTIYSALYQILAADSSLNALRTDNALFHKCLNIQSFITHFQSMSTDKEFHNYKSGYKECALSTNFFLFGCHSDNGSNTISYYANNETCASMDLKNMLETSLKSMGVPDSMISKLAELEKEFPQRGQGVIYQIGLPQDQVDHYAYLAGVGGVLNPLPNASDDAYHVSCLLRAINNNEAVPAEYIKTLQARVMVPPDAPITTNHYYWGEPIELANRITFYKQLNSLTKDMAYYILKYQNILLNSKTALLRYLPNIMQQAGINPTEQAVSDELIINFIEIKAFESIKIIVKEFPEYKDKLLIYNNKQYPAFFSSASTHDTPKTLLERLLSIENSGDTIRAIYGNAFYEGKLDKLPFHRVVNTFPANDQVEFIAKYQDQIQSCGQIALILDVLPEAEKVKVASILHEKITNGGELAKVVLAIPENERFKFATKYKSLIRNAHELADVIAAMPKDNQFAFAIDNKNLIKNDCLSYYISKVHNTNDFFNIVKMIINNGADLSLEDECGKTPLHHAVIEMRLNIVEEILKKGKNALMNIQDNSGKTVLHHAFIFGRYEIQKLLLDHGADPNMQDKSGKTPLHYAVACKLEYKIKLLLDHKAKLDIQDNEGQTPLHYSVEITDNYRGFSCLPVAKVTEMLLEKGADFYITDKENRTPLDLANKEDKTTYNPEKEQIQQLLKEYGAKYDYDGVVFLF